jgi:hypothetical protein
MRLLHDLRMAITVQGPFEIPGLHVRNEFLSRQEETNRSVDGTGEVQGNPLRQTVAAISYLLVVQHGGGYGNFERIRAERLCRNSNVGDCHVREEFSSGSGR